MEPVRDQSEPRNIESAFFVRGPLRSYYFIAGTITMGIDLAMVGFLLVVFGIKCRRWLSSKSGLLWVPCWYCGIVLTSVVEGFMKCILKPNRALHLLVHRLTQRCGMLRPSQAPVYPFHSLSQRGFFLPSAQHCGAAESS